MKRYEYERIHNGRLFGANFEESRAVINRYAEKGFRYVGWIPVVMNDYGKIKDLDLIFKKDMEDPWN